MSKTSYTFIFFLFCVIVAAGFSFLVLLFSDLAGWLFH
jgi:hypothetical protein